MSRRTMIWIAAGAVVLVVAGTALWWFVLRSDAPDPVSLDEAVIAAGGSTTVASESGEPPDDSGAQASGVEGDWSAAPDGRSFVGYRVNERLAGIGAVTAAGRTTGVTGGLTIEGSTVTVVTIDADLTGLRSDDSRRDGALRRQALETDRFPTASFRLAEPISLPENASGGEPFAVNAVGDLEIHGVSNRVTIPLEAQLVGDAIAVAGSLEIQFADYDIEPPSAVIVLSVEDRGIMEFQLIFTRG
jgi:polyisoprenoid-binding protein YceI